MQNRKRPLAQGKGETQQQTCSLCLLGPSDLLHLFFSEGGSEEVANWEWIPNSACITIKSPTAKILNTPRSSLQ